MKVLLLSPLPDLDPACGDVTYTQTLLQAPPDGVDYETYASALQRGALREHGIRPSLSMARKGDGHLLSEFALTTVSHGLSRLRRWKWLFWEPFRFFSVRPGEYDLIHLHVFNARFFGLSCPLIASNAAPLNYLYSEARHYSPGRAAILAGLDTGLARAMRVNHCSYHLPQVGRLVAFTEYLKVWYCARGVFPAERIDVVPIYLPEGQATRPTGAPKRIGFIAKDFVAKGGEVLLQAFASVRRERPDAELWIVGSEPQLASEEAERRGLTWLPYVPREGLLADVLPSFDVFAYPTTCDGLPLTVLEALSYGIPVATSDYQAMPEVVSYGAAGLVSPVGDVPALAANLLTLLNPETNANYRARSLAHFRNTFSADTVRSKLRASYERAIQEGTQAAS